MNESGAAYLGGIEGDVLAQWRTKSRNQLYRTDPEAWLWDVLGYRWHNIQREITESFMTSRRVATKSCNGAGKSRWLNEIASWGISVHEPGELLIIMSAPGMRQIQETSFAYLAANYSRARSRGFQMPGSMTDSRWSYRETPTSKSKTLVIGQKPADQDIVGTFQGIRAISDADTKTWVFIDEGGAVHADLFVAAEAVTTGAGDNKIDTIGNPDNTGTYFQRIFEDERISQDWKTHTISALDLPTFTGEIVYDDPEMQRQMLESGMVDFEWVEQKKRAWGEDSARYLSKVLGQFPNTSDWCFFSQTVINIAGETEIEPDAADGSVLGVDLADGGEDDSKAYVNRGGQIRHHSTWNEGSESPNRIHEAALETGSDIVVIDRLGIGAGPYNSVAARADRFYTLVGAKASEKSPDPSRWANSRAYWYDTLREAMLNGEVDLDYYAVDEHGNEVGRSLRDQLLSIVYGFNSKGAIQIEPKKEMRKRGVTSPDDLDAVVFAYAVKAKLLVDGPLAGLEPGDRVEYDPYDDLADRYAGMPI